MLPPELKEQVQDYYQQHKDWILTTDFSDHVKENYAKVLNGVEKFMMSEDYSEQWLEHFIDSNPKLDEVRTQIY